MDNTIIETPCISVCRLSDGKCVGCGRTDEEIIEWYNYTDEQRREIMERLEEEDNDLFD